MVRQTLAGQRLLVTGVTGFLGKVWLTHLLAHVPEIGRVTVVVRPGKRQTALQRFEHIASTSPAFRPLRAQHGADLGRFLGQRVEVLAGDVERPLMGLGRATVQALEIDAVVHCAGLTDFQPDPLRAVAVNVLGARHAADVARRAGARLMHVSTCFVAGQVSGEVAETLTPGIGPSGQAFTPAEEIGALQAACRSVPRKDERVDIGLQRARSLGWPNIYTYSKGLAEHLLTTADPAFASAAAGGPSHDLRTCIVRPSIVECARSWPFSGWNEGLNTAGPLAWLITTAFRDLPARPSNHFDVVPVDDVARGMTLALAALLGGEAAPVYQLAAGDKNPLTFGRTIELTGLAHRRWTRKGGGERGDRLTRHLDPVPAPSGGPLAVPRLKRFVGAIRRGLTDLDPKASLPEAVAEAVTPKLREARAKLADVEGRLGRVEHMLELYRPFIHDHDYVFATDRVRALSDALEEGESELAWQVPAIDWRRYWVDVEYPGLCTWSIPIIRGETIPEDTPRHPVRLIREPAPPVGAPADPVAPGLPLAPPDATGPTPRPDGRPVLRVVSGEGTRPADRGPGELAVIERSHGRGT